MDSPGYDLPTSVNAFFKYRSFGVKFAGSPESYPGVSGDREGVSSLPELPDFLRRSTLGEDDALVD
jgi:hypothetical protein